MLNINVAYTPRLWLKSITILFCPLVLALGQTEGQNLVGATLLLALESFLHPKFVPNYLGSRYASAQELFLKPALWVQCKQVIASYENNQKMERE